VVMEGKREQRDARDTHPLRKSMSRSERPLALIQIDRINAGLSRDDKRDPWYIFNRHYNVVTIIEQ